MPNSKSLIRPSVIAKSILADLKATPVREVKDTVKAIRSINAGK